MPSSMSSHAALLRRLPTSLNTTTSTRSLSTTLPLRGGSILFALGQLSNSRETQHFAKRSKLSRVEHSPPLELIRSSEVDPFAPKKKKETKAAVTTAAAAGTKPGGVKQEFERNITNFGSADVTPIMGMRMNADTPAFDARLATFTQYLTARLERSGREIQDLEKGLSSLQKEVGTLVKTVGLLMFLLVGGATGVAMWQFWPQEKNPRTTGDMGRRLAEKTKTIMHLPPASSLRRDIGTQTGLGGTDLAAVMGEPAILPLAAKAADARQVVQPVKAEQEEWRWWRNLFWKQR